MKWSIEALKLDPRRFQPYGLRRGGACEDWVSIQIEWCGKSLETWFGAPHKPSLLGVSITCHRCRIDGFEAPKLGSGVSRLSEFNFWFETHATVSVRDAWKAHFSL